MISIIQTDTHNFAWARYGRLEGDLVHCQIRWKSRRGLDLAIERTSVFNQIDHRFDVGGQPRTQVY